VGGDRVEVGAELGHVELELRPRLSTVDDQQGARVVRHASDLGDRVDRAEHV
jgi:hypothetical protein